MERLDRKLAAWAWLLLRAAARAWATGSEDSEGERDERDGDHGGDRGFDRSAIARRLANRTADRDDIARLMACSSRPPRSCAPLPPVAASE